MAHLSLLEERFGAEAVLGGTCFVSTTVASDGTIVHMNDTRRLTLAIETNKVTCGCEYL